MKDRLDLLPPIVRFAMVGTFAYVVDAGTLLVLSEWMAVIPARLIAFVRSGLDVSEEIKQRLLGQLQQATVPTDLVKRLERRIGG